MVDESAILYMLIGLLITLGYGTARAEFTARCLKRLERDYKTFVESTIDDIKILHDQAFH